ncbi:MAG: cation transporter [Gemmatimonadetes bacterium]|nr:cation transporter [Gemmatimonadota bacterium]
MGPGPHCVPAPNQEQAEASSGEARPSAAPPGAAAPGTGPGDAPHDAAHPHAHARHGQGRHGHGHHRLLGQKGLKLVLAITATFMVAEFAGGVLANSLALMADAAHMLTDVAALALALLALRFAQRPATAGKTYGYLRLEILAALVNGAGLIVLSFFIFYEAYRRMQVPVAVESGLMLAVASLGLAVNLVAAWILQRSAGHSLNVRGAYLHVLGDLLGSVGAILAAVLILSTGWLRADPLVSVAVGVLILVSSWNLVKESVNVLLEAVPAYIDLKDVRQAIDEIPGVDDVHDLHVWTVTSGFLAMSGHAVVQQPQEHHRILLEIHRRMREQFGIRHVTVQLEREAAYVSEEHL